MDKKRVLVVDDEQDLCDILLYNLRKEGYEAESAYSAEEALAMQPQKADDGTRRLPIIFLTAKDTEDDMLHGFHLGADDYVSKPFPRRHRSRPRHRQECRPAARRHHHRHLKRRPHLCIYT